jgi:hypothetical protein
VSFHRSGDVIRFVMPTSAKRSSDWEVLRSPN